MRSLPFFFCFVPPIYILPFASLGLPRLVSIDWRQGPINEHVSKNTIKIPPIRKEYERLQRHHYGRILLMMVHEPLV